jgi:anti-anti-sigma factor
MHMSGDTGEAWTRSPKPADRRSLPIAGGEISDLRIESEERDGVCIVHLCGDVDLMTVSSLQLALNSPARTSRPVVLDCARLRYIDSKGLSLLAGLSKAGLRLVLAVPSSTIRKVLRVMALDVLLPAASSVDEALTLLAGRASGSAADG